MLVAVAFCPAPPLLVPEVACGAAGELADLRAACDSAVAALLDTAADEIAVLGPGTITREHPGDARGSLSGFGVDVGTGTSGAFVLAASLTIGGWLLDRAGAPTPSRAMVEVGAGASTDETVLLGRQLASRPARTALLVMGDGAASRSPAAPVAFDPGAVDWDDAVAAFLAAGDTGALAALDPARASAVGASGLPAWHAAAAAVAAPGGLTDFRADLLAYQAPYGVGYFVATWLPR